MRTFGQTRSRRQTLRGLAGVLAVGALALGERSEEAGAHNPLKTCKKKSGKQKKVCIKKAKAHNATHTVAAPAPSGTSACTPNCSGGRNCGSDGCSGSCGSCTAPQTCGGGGTAGVCGGGTPDCGTCATGQRCAGGGCVCDAQSCAGGCCDGTTCKGGNADGACGSNGGVCSSCNFGQRCAGGRCVCDAQSCDGCCDGTMCRGGGSGGACGSGGDACRVCASSETCSDGACVCGGACVCPALQANCTTAEQCTAGCEGEVACGPIGNLGQNQCCRPLGAPCSNPGEFDECCTVVFEGGGGSLVTCAPNNTCGGPGAQCHSASLCASGVCCGFPGMGEEVCCAAGQQCDENFQCTG